jgi:hypothetical protein
MEVLLLAVMGAVNILCFVIGAKVGQAVSKGEKIKLPELDPLKAYREHQNRQEAKKKQDIYEAILRNVDSYDGTPYGQEDIPRG